MIGKYRIAVVVAYFGKLPEWFEAWRISAFYNENIDFIFFTDNHEVQSADNIIVHYMSFTKFRQCIQNKFDFEIVLDSPYKLCDYKPSYGFTLSDWLSGYDFWGYCDIDLVYGRIDHFVTEELLDVYPHLHQIGHFSLYRNDESMNTLFMNPGSYPEYNYTEAFTTSDSCYFDEFRGMECKIKRNNVKVFNFINKFTNIPPLDNVFRYRGEQFIGRWIKGQLYIECKSGKRIEALYFHISQRTMKLDINSLKHTESFVIVPGKLIPDCKETSEKLFEYESGNKICYKNMQRFKRLSKQIRRYGIRKILMLRARDKKIHNYIEILNNNDKVSI